MGIIHANYLTAGVLVESSVLGFFVLFVDFPSLPSGHAKIPDEYLLSFIRYILSKVNLLKVSA